MAKRRRSGGGFFFGLMVGLVLGAALALFFAQDSETRARGETGEPGLSQRRQDLRERYAVALAQGREAYQRVRDEVLTRYHQRAD